MSRVRDSATNGFRLWSGSRSRATVAATVTVTGGTPDTGHGSNKPSDILGSRLQQVSPCTEVKRFKDIPGPKPSLPFIGTGWQYFPGGRYKLFQLHQANYDKYQRYGPIVKEEYQWQKPIVQIFSPDDFEVVFRSQGKYPQRPANEFMRHYRKNNPHKYDSAGIANSLGEEWYDLRCALGPVLSKLKEVDSLLPSLNGICQDMVELLRRPPNSDGSNRIQNLQEVLYKLALESICLMCLDTRLGCLSPNLDPSGDANQMIQAAQDMFNAYQKLYYGLPLWKFFPTPAYKLLDRAESIIYDTASRYMNLAMAAQSNQAGERSLSVLETVLSIKSLSENERRLTIIDFISGGIFTVTNSLCFLLFHLAQNPLSQDRLYQELASKAPGGDITPQALPHLPYLRACIKEAFRLSPTVPGVMRILPDDVVLSGYHVPAGTAIFCHFMVTCKLKEYFPKPECFLPERWLGEQKQSQHKFCMLPFGFGNRMCAGRRFSQMELYVAAAKMVWNFRMQSETEKLDLTHAFIVVPSNPVTLQLHDR